MKSHPIMIATVLCGALVSLATAGSPPATPAMQKIEDARSAINANPDHCQGYNALAMALAQRARETADPAYYDQALEAVDRSLALVPDNFAARKVKVWVQLGQHEFAKALEAARALNKQAPDDVMVYGYLVDAAVEMGLYDEAEAAAQWMLDLRPGNVPGLTRAAYLRELFGDLDGAVELMAMAYQSIPGHETEHRAWVLTHIGHLYRSGGKLELASEVLEEALKIFPGYHYALAQLAHTRTAQGQHEQALALYQKHYEVAAHPENLYLVGQALAQLGRDDEAQKAYQQFEEGARGEIDSPDNANHDLIFYYTDHANNPQEALRIAKIEIQRRKDVHTRDAYAWALYTNGQHDEAYQQIERALSVGIQDAKIFFHAGAIAQAKGDEQAARRYFHQAAALNPGSPPPAAARQARAALGDRPKP